jgi:glycosyl transferase family 25
MGMHIYVINLARSLDRRISMSAKLAGSNAVVEFVDAVEGSTVDRHLYPMADGLSDGEVGCYLSHVSVWQTLLESTHEFALVLEDDVVLKDELVDLCNDFSRLPFEVDLIRISSLKKAKGIDAWPLESHRLLIADMHPSGSQGYWLSRQGAVKLLAGMSAPSQELDKALDRCWQSRMQAFLLDPPAVYEEPTSTSLISKRSSRQRPGWVARRLEGWRRRIANRRQRRHLQRQLAK